MIIPDKGELKQQFNINIGLVNRRSLYIKTTAIVSCLPLS